MPRYTRRRFLAVGAVTIGSMAGCASNTSSESTPSGDGPRAQSSFFVFGDFATEVSGEAATAQTLVLVGQHGHGWEPGPQVQGTVLESDLFIYGLEGFQPWADDLVESFSDESDIEIVAAGSGIDLISGDHDYGSDHEDEHDHSHADGTDPHFWLDPGRAKRAVDTIRGGFAAVDSTNSDKYAKNADEYRSRLDELDGTFESALETASKETVVVGGHNAFGYLEQQYDFEVKS